LGRARNRRGMPLQAEYKEDTCVSSRQTEGARTAVLRRRFRDRGASQHKLDEETKLESAGSCFEVFAWNDSKF